MVISMQLFGAIEIRLSLQLEFNLWIPLNSTSLINIKRDILWGRV